jgi:hypothetical protein
MKTMFAVLLLSVVNESSALHFQRSDSTAIDSMLFNPKRNATRRITMRIHSMGFFNFSGRICANTPAADLNLFFEKNGYAISLFSAKDLTDIHNDNNFAFAIFQKRFAVSKRLSLTTHAGLLMDHFTQSFGDRFFLTSAFKVSPKLTIDETSLAANLLSDQDREWVNRIRFIYTETSHLQFILSTWHNNALFDVDQHVSAAMQASYNRIEVSPHLYLHTSLTYFMMAASTEEVPNNEKNGVLLSLGFSLE